MRPILEDALMRGSDKIGDYMVRKVVTASPWQPLSFIRYQMLVNSFTFLPVLTDTGEVTNNLVADISIARYLQNGNRKERLAHKLSEAVGSNQITYLQTTMYTPDKTILVVLSDETVTSKRLPILVVDKEERKHLVGLLTAFDLL